MKIKVLSALLFFSLFGGSFIGNAAEVKSGDVPGSRLIVYYFHGNVRCANCHKIENYTEGTVENYFKEQLRSGKIVYKMINIEEKGNAHFIKDYELYTKSVVLSLVKDGKEAKYKNLTKVWEYLGNKTAFEDYERKEIKAFLKEL
ncbi:MAG: nitrophenyl compound nitroreductase subunit ArsF family protein [Candidatus Omnitrophota bacterium]